MGSSFEPLCHTKRHDKYILPAPLPKTKWVWTSPLSVISETVQYSIFLIICVWETVQKSWIRGIYFRHCWLLFQKLSTIYHMTCVQQNVFHTALKIFQEGFFSTTKQTASKDKIAHGCALGKMQYLESLRDLYRDLRDQSEPS